MSIYAILPARGFIDPADSGSSTLGQAAPVMLAFDAMISEQPDFTATPTQSIVEDGSTISDHVTLKPIKLQVHGVITDTPLGQPRGTLNRSANGKPMSATAFDYIKTLYLNKQPFDFVGGLQVYSSMVITSFKPIRNAETGDALRFECTMEQVLIVSSEVLTQQPEEKKNQQKTSHGGQPLQAASTSQSALAGSTFQNTDPTAASNGFKTSTVGVSSDNPIVPASEWGGVATIPSGIGAVAGSLF